MTLKTRPYDPAEDLDTPQAIATYLDSILEEGDTKLLVTALGHVARARGMTSVARDSGLAREALYRALAADAQPRFDTIARVCSALGVRLTVQPAG